MAKTSVLTIMIQLAKEGNADRETVKGLAGLQSSLTKTVAMFGAFAGVAIGAGRALGVTVNAVVDYAAQVRELSRITGASAEETSRLIQAADDATISYESLQKALWAAAKNGVEVNIESLARLADEYVALNSATAQAEFLAKNFGKSSAEMAKLLERGGAAVQYMTDSISDSLVLTEQAVDAAREYEIQVDNLTDQWEALKMTLGTGVLPVLNEVLATINQSAAIWQTATQLIEEHKARTMEQATAMAAVIVKNREWKAQAYELSAGMNTAAGAVDMATQANVEYAESIDEISRRNQGLLGLVMDMQSEEDRYKQKQDELITKVRELYGEQSKYFEGGRKWKEIQGEIDDTKVAIDQLAAEHEEASKRIAFSLLQQKAAADGLTDAEFKGLLAVGTQWGIIDEKVAESAIIMDKQASDMAESLQEPDGQLMDIVDKLNNLGKKSGSVFDFYVNIHTTGSFGNIPTRGTSSGPGAGMANNAFMDNEFDVWQNAAGGQLGPITIVGEGPSGWSPTAEVIVGNTVLPHDVAQQLKDAGLLEGARQAMFGVEDAFTGGETAMWKAAQRKKRRRTSTVAPVRSTSGSGSQAAAEVSETVSAATAVSAAAVQSSVEVQQQATKEAVQTRATIQQGNTDILTALRENNELLRQQMTTMQRSIVAAVQQVAP